MYISVRPIMLDIKWEGISSPNLQKRKTYITIDDKLKFQIHINNQTKKANQRLGMINRSFTYMDKNMFTTLYKSIVRPHLEYGSNIWSVMYKKEAIQIENVQRRATKLVKNIQHLSYSDRSRYLGLPSLQYRRLRSDIVETFRIINNIDRVNSNKIFPKNENTTRGHKHKIYKKQCRTNIRKYSFSQRVVDTWNSLPAKVKYSKWVQKQVKFALERPQNQIQARHIQCTNRK